MDTPLGMSPAPLEALVRELAGDRGVGLAGLSAANALRLSTQVPRLAHVAVPVRLPALLGPVRFVARPTRTARVAASLRPMDVAVLEVLDAWESVVEVPAVTGWSLLTGLLAVDGELAARLVLAAPTEPARVRARLELLLRASGHDDLAACLPRVDSRTRAAALAFLGG